jgi:hypothetical protein
LLFYDEVERKESKQGSAPTLATGFFAQQAKMFDAGAREIADARRRQRLKKSN